MSPPGATLGRFLLGERNQGHSLILYLPDVYVLASANCNSSIYYIRCRRMTTAWGSQDIARPRIVIVSKSRSGRLRHRDVALAPDLPDRRIWGPESKSLVRDTTRPSDRKQLRCVFSGWQSGRVCCSIVLSYDCFHGPQTWRKLTDCPYQKLEGGTPRCGSEPKRQLDLPIRQAH